MTTVFNRPVRLMVGLVPSASAAAWLAWSEALCQEQIASRFSAIPDAADVLHQLGEHLVPAMPEAAGPDASFKCHAEIDPDRLEHMALALFNLDRWLAAEVARGGRSALPDDARAFHVALVRALLHTLESDSPGRAEFVDHLRPFWPTALEGD